ncbi:MAG: ABC transporter permease [Gammaproteobacteria bacterium]|nr:ABC transporter permease [Gammaproteobacteria bacterium]
MSRHDYEAVAARIPEIRWLYAGGLPRGPIEVTGPSGAAEALDVHLVSAGFFDALGVRPALGTLSAPNDGPALVLSDASWRRVFGREDVVGTMLQVTDGPTLPVIGVAAPEFAGVMPDEPGAWLMNPPLALSLSDFAAGVEPETRREIARRMANVAVFGAVADPRDLESTMTEARARLADYRFDGSLILADVRALDGSGDTVRQGFAFGVSDTDWIDLGPGLETAPAARRDVVQKTTWLVGIVGMLLAMTFVSVVEFLMAENVAREEEQNVRVAVGATPLDLFRQAVAENVPIVGGMALVAWLTSGYALDVLIGVEPFSDYLGELSTASRVSGLWMAGVLLVASLLICLGYASWFVARSSRALTRSSEWLRRTMRRVLLLAGTASLVVVLSLAERYLGEARLSLGFANADTLVVTLVGPEQRVWSDVSPFVDAIQSVPGVHSAATGLEPLASMVRLRSFTREVLDRPDLSDTAFYENAITPGFFETLGIELLAGRLFGPGQDEVVVARSAAEALGGIEAALGMRLGLRGQHSGDSEATVVGVVDDVPYGGYAATGRPMVYAPIRYIWSHQNWLIAADPGFDAVDALGQLPEFVGWQIEVEDTPAQAFRKQFLAKRSVEIVLSVAGAFALALALSGVGNSLARTIAEARTPIGIRFALGALPGELGRVYFGASVRDLVLAGVLVCLAGLAAKTFMPAFAETVQLWLLVPALAGLVAVCGVMIHVLMGQLARRHTVIALVNATAARGRSA